MAEERCEKAKYGNCGPIKDGEDYCLFHKPDKCEEEAGLFYEKLKEQARPEANEAAISRLLFKDEVNWKGYVFPKYKRYPSNWTTYENLTTLLETIFSGWPGFQNAIFCKNINFEYAFFEDDANFDGSIFKGQTNFENVTFGDSASFEKAIFKKGVTFGFSCFRGKTKFRVSTFEHHANFWNAKIEGKADFFKTIFLSGVTFRYVKFNNQTLFWNTFFGGEVDFKWSIFKGLTNFNGSIFGDKFEDKVDFQGASFEMGVNFKDVTFGGEVLFRFANFTIGAYFLNANFKKRVTFRNATFGGSVSFERGWFCRDVIFSGACFERTCSFKGRYFGGDLLFTNSDFRQGLVMDEDWKYPEKGKYTLSKAEEESCRVQKIAFDKEGKKEASDAMFVREMRARRSTRIKSNKKPLWKNPNIYILCWLEKWAIDKTSKYGTDWYSLVKATLLVIVSFSLIYFLSYFNIGFLGDLGQSFYYNFNFEWSWVLFRELCDVLLQSIYFSIVAFTTLGSDSLNPEGLMRFIVGAQSLIGAFFIALFVVVFARKWMR